MPNPKNHSFIHSFLPGRALGLLIRRVSIYRLDCFTFPFRYIFTCFHINSSSLNCILIVLFCVDVLGYWWCWWCWWCWWAFIDLSLIPNLASCWRTILAIESVSYRYFMKVRLFVWGKTLQTLVVSRWYAVDDLNMQLMYETTIWCLDSFGCLAIMSKIDTILWWIRIVPMVWKLVVRNESLKREIYWMGVFGKDKIPEWNICVLWA